MFYGGTPPCRSKVEMSLVQSRNSLLTTFRSLEGGINRTTTDDSEAAGPTGDLEEAGTGDRSRARKFELRCGPLAIIPDQGANHTNFLDPSTNLSANTFGRIQSARDPRIMQFALKYTF